MEKRKRTVATVVIVLLLLMIASPVYARTKTDNEDKNWLGSFKSEYNDVYWKLVVLLGPAALVYGAFNIIKAAVASPEKSAEYYKRCFYGFAGYALIVLLPWIFKWLRIWLQTLGVKTWRPGR